MKRDKIIYSLGEHQLSVNEQGTISLLFTGSWCSRELSLEDGKQTINRILMANAYDALTYKMGRPEYAPNVHEIQNWIDEYIKKQGQPPKESANTETC